MRVLVIGGYGVFGGRLVRLLLAEGHEMLVAGRSLSREGAFCARHGGQPVELAESGSAPGWHGAEVVVDAEGPCQQYGADPYARARSVLAAGAHYLDLSDDAAFTAGIGALDDRARAADRVALSGVSSVPAISAAAVRELAQGLTELTLIETAILPGNRAPRGRSVMTAILSQVGRPISLWRGGHWTTNTAWRGTWRIGIPGLGQRAASLIGAPDLWLFSSHFGARSVVFRAGLELALLHRGLGLLGWGAARLGRSLAPLAGALGVCAQIVEGFGSDRGGMVVHVAGRDRYGSPLIRRWWLVAGAGGGPFVPAIPATVVIDALAAGRIAPGARPCLDDIPLAALSAVLDQLGFESGQDVSAAPRLFEAALGDGWRQLPKPLHELHDVWDRQVFEGEAEIARGRSLAARTIAALFRFPPVGRGVPVRVTMTRSGGCETWERDFGGRRLRSVLSPAGPGSVDERFGPWRFKLKVPVRDGRLEMPVVAGWFLGLPIPRALLPVSETAEREVDGKATFHVRLSAPLVRLIVHYRGWLVPARGDPAQMPAPAGEVRPAPA